MANLFGFPSLRPKKQKPLIADTHEFYIRGKKFVVDEHYILDENPIGSGAYGDVCAGTNTKLRGKRVAIKKISRCFTDLVDAKRILREVKMIGHFRHPNIVSIVDMIPPASVEEFRDVYICLNLVDTDLQKLLRSRNRELTHPKIKYLTYQLLCALKYMHSARVMHRDLKPSNLLISLRDCRLQICDFGLARPIDYPGEITEYVVTRWYRAPEIMCACQDYDEKSDVWSVGCIFAEMYLRTPVFKGKNYLHQLELIFKCFGTGDDLLWLSNETAVQFLGTMPAEPSIAFEEKFPKIQNFGNDLLLKLMKVNPSQRFSVDDALSHPYFVDCRKTRSETVCAEAFDYSYEDSVNTEEELKGAMFEEVIKWRRAAQRRQKSWL